MENTFYNHQPPESGGRSTVNSNSIQIFALTLRRCRIPAFLLCVCVCDAGSHVRGPPLAGRMCIYMFIQPKSSVQHCIRCSAWDGICVLEGTLHSRVRSVALPLSHAPEKGVFVFLAFPGLPIPGQHQRIGRLCSSNVEADVQW